jgi:HCNGP-like protein
MSSLVAYGDSDSDSDADSPLVPLPTLSTTHHHSGQVNDAGPQASSPKRSRVDEPRSLSGTRTETFAAASMQCGDGQVESAASSSEAAVAPVGPQVDATVQANIAALLSAHGSAFIALLRSKKEFNNPYTLDKVSEFTGIDSFGSNFAVRPGSQFTSNDFYDALAARQRAVTDGQPHSIGFSSAVAQPLEFVP